MKLLDRTLRTYLLYSVGVMLTSTPVFYAVIERLFVDDVDEALLVRKEVIQRQLAQFADEQTLLNWRDLEGNTRLRPVGPRTSARDSIYNAVYTEQVDSLTTEAEPFRELSARLSYRGRPIELITRISLVESEDLLRAVVLTQGGLLTLLLLGLVLLNRRIARRLWQPFYATLERLRQFEVNQDAPLQLPPSAIAEFEELNQTLGVLTGRSHHTFLKQKEFTENAAHEMQTPLAIFQSKLERLSQTQPLTDEQAGLIGSLNAVTVRLSRLNKSLLLLTRIDNHQYGAVGAVNLTALLDSLLDELAGSIDVKELRVERTSTGAGPTLRVNRTLLEMLLSNLLVNAIRYTPPGGQIHIDVQPNELTVANPGEPLAISSDKLFSRFQKGEAQTGGVGLGLAIAQKIAEVNGYGLTYHHAQGQHHFSLVFG